MHAGLRLTKMVVKRLDGNKRNDDGGRTMDDADYGKVIGLPSRPQRFIVYRLSLALYLLQIIPITHKLWQMVFDLF